jgi:hypothetical protein
MSTPTRKFIVEYELPYTHVVRVGISSATPEEAIHKADSKFSDCTLWDDTPEVPLLYDDYEENGDAGDVLKFKVVGEVGEWPDKDASVKALENDRLARRVCELLLASDTFGEPAARESVLRTAVQLAGRVMQSHGGSGEPPIQAVIGIEGGLVQWVCTSHPLDFVVLDFDTETASPADLVEVQCADSGNASVFRFGSLSATVNPDWVSTIHRQADGQ